MAFTQEDTPEQILSASLSNYIYNMSETIPHTSDYILWYLASTPVYLSHVTNPDPDSIHISQRAVGVLLHKLGVRPTP